MGKCTFPGDMTHMFSSFRPSIYRIHGTLAAHIIQYFLFIKGLFSSIKHDTVRLYWFDGDPALIKQNHHNIYD